MRGWTAEQEVRSEETRRAKVGKGRCARGGKYADRGNNREVTGVGETLSGLPHHCPGTVQHLPKTDFVPSMGASTLPQSLLRLGSSHLPRCQNTYRETEMWHHTATSRTEYNPKAHPLTTLHRAGTCRSSQNRGQDLHAHADQATSG